MEMNKLDKSVLKLWYIRAVLLTGSASGRGRFETTEEVRRQQGTE